MQKLVLVDAYAMIYRAYYALIRAPRVNSKGMNTSAIFGFINTVQDMLRRESPDYVGVAFDPRGGSFRNEIYPAYKAQREETPEDIRAALPYIKQWLMAMNIAVYEVAGYEADDVIGTLATKASERPDLDSYMMTLDKDYGQLVKPNVRMLRPQHASSGFDVWGPKEICDKYGIDSPLKVIDLLGLMGDASDNVPGCPGVGEKTAVKLINEFGGIDELLERSSELKGSIKTKVEDNKEGIRFSKLLVTIKTDVPVELNLEELSRKEPNNEALEALYKELEFWGFLKAVTETTGNSGNPRNPGNLGNLGNFGKPAKSTKPQTSGMLDLFGGEMGTMGPISPISPIGPIGQRYLNHDGCIVGYDLKAALQQGAGSKEQEEWGESSELFDIMIANYVLRSDVHNYDDRDYSLEVRDRLTEAMKRDGVYELFRNIEMPLVPVLARMEQNGVKIDVESLSATSREFGERMQIIEHEVHQLAGTDFNISSPKQVGEVLFEKLKLVDKPKKTKSGQYVTSEEVLQGLKGKHPIVEKILDYRGYKKLLSTYIDALPGLINPETGHIHTSFNQAVTVTGRLSSSNPNLQNIPIRDENGREVRKSFIPDDGCLFFSADYSQIELRIMAHLSQDENLIEAFREGHDIHSATAAKLFKKPISEITTDERRKAKTANFGIIYGISVFGLAERMQVPRAEAKQLIDDYFTTYHRVKEYMDKSIEKARDFGYTTTLFGRRCYLPDINSHNSVVRGYAERNAINAPIQGTAADIIKIAMVNIDRRMQREGVKSKMILQVHDELNFNVPPEEKDLMQRLVIEEMEKACQLSVPLIADCGWGTNWLEAH